jgi:TetR/AcrR family transcriptional repressor of nem operon
MLPTRKQETHDRIVGTAARTLRRRGYAGVGVADVMQEAGLTHGGFYAHFGSRADLLAEAADRAGADSVGALRRLAEAAPAGRGLRTLVDAYLSAEHVTAPELACPLAAAGSELPHQEPQVRAAATARIREMAALVEDHLPGRASAARREQALAVVAGLVGTLMLARAVDDPALAESLRSAGRRFLLAPSFTD